MSIRLLAKDLYRLIKEVGQLEKQIDNEPVEKQEDLKDRLRKLKAERDRVRYMLEGKKDMSLGRKF